MNDTKAELLSAMQVRLTQTESVMATMSQELLRLTTEVSRNHSLLVDVESAVRRSQETQLSFVEHTRASALASLLRPLDVVGHELLRFGSDNDGGYLMVDDWIDLVGLVSGGAGDNVDFEVEVAKRDLVVHVYDHTVPTLPSHGHELITHVLEPLGTSGTSLDSALSRMPEGDLLLKIDIDGAEWGLFDGAASGLNRFRQIVLELHGLHQLGDSLWYERALRVLHALHETHAPVHVHANNYGAYAVVGGIPVPDIVEVSYVRRDAYDLVERTSAAIAHPLDQANDPTRPEYALSLLG